MENSNHKGLVKKISFYKIVEKCNYLELPGIIMFSNIIMVDRIISAHDTWIKSHHPRRCLGYEVNVYLQMMIDIRKVMFKVESSMFEEQMKMWFQADLLQEAKQDPDNQFIEQLKKETLTIDADKNWAFITIGYNEQTITPSLMKTQGEKLSKLKYFSDVQYVHEKHRENGIHHHTHFLVKTVSSIPKSKLIQYVFQIAGMKNVVLGKQFIDIKTYKDGSTYENYMKYISGDKKAEKLKYCELDSQWRKKYNL